MKDATVHDAKFERTTRIQAASLDMAGSIASVSGIGFADRTRAILIADDGNREVNVVT